jgi:hypothetical protein
VEINQLAGGFTGTLSNLDKLVKLSQGLLCMGMTAATLLTNPSSLFKSIGYIAASAGNLITNAIIGRMQYRVASVLGIAAVGIRLLKSYLESGRNLLSNLNEIYQKVKNKKTNLLDYLYNTQNCAVQAANFLNCISAVIAKKITKKVLPKIDSEFDRIQNEVAGAVYSAGGVMEQHVGRNLRSMERLSKQINAML